MAVADFWGELQEATTTTPVSIMRKQAALLGPKTKHLVEARVETQTRADQFFHSFNLVAPAMDNYTYQLFQISHGIELYPVIARTDGWELNTEAEFTEWLRDRLASAETRRIINNLISQSRS